MAINPLQLPAYAAPQQADFSSLAELPKIYRQRQAEDVRRQTLAELGQGGQIDPMRLIQSGDMNLANLGIGIMNRQKEEARQAQQDARQLQRDAVTDRHNAAYLGIAQRNAARADADAGKPIFKEVPRQDGSGGVDIYRITRDGKASLVDTGGTQPQAAPGNPFGPGKFNEGEGKASGFTDRMLQSEGVLSGFAPDGGMGPPSPARDVEGTSMQSRGAAAIPLVGNFMVGENFQKYDQAKRDFINAQLRRESGAAIAPSEFDSADRQYFPRPGDSKQVIDQKRKNRRAAIEAMGREGGRSYRPKATFGDDGMLRSYGQPASQPAQTGPRPGEVQDGYRFKGGNPGDPSSWVKVQ